MICLNCYNDTNFETKKEHETIVVRGEDIEIESEVTYCKNCNAKVWNEELDNNNLIKAYELYKKNHGLLTSSDIKFIRENYNISQSTFSRILGLGEKTITRYENGSIQDTAQNNLILLAKNINNFKVLFEKQKSILRPEEIAKIEEILSGREVKLLFNNQNATAYGIKDLFFGGFTYEEQQRQYEFESAV